MSFSKQQHKEKIKRAQTRTSSFMPVLIAIALPFFVVTVLFLWKVLPGETLNLPCVCLPVIPDLTAHVTGRASPRC